MVSSSLAQSISWRTSQRCIYRCGVQSGRGPAGYPLLPLIIGQLPYIGTVRTHYEYFAIRLGSPHLALVLPSHSGTDEGNPFSIGRPHLMRIITVRVGQLAQSRAIRTNGV